MHYPFELLGALVMAVQFCPQFGIVRGIWYSVFHSISAFCNAGFDLMGGTSGPYSSLTSYRTNPFITIPVMALIVIGGIGFFVWDDIYKHRQSYKFYRLQTKIVLTTTFLLILIPAVSSSCLSSRRSGGKATRLLIGFIRQFSSQ